jgi:putative N6-adenine-specific DNA methylase
MPERLPLFATAARGTEDLLAQELEELGGKRVRQDRGGVRFLANLHEALRICLWSRIAMRVLYPLATAEAQGADGLYAATHAVAWEEHLTPEVTFAVDASLKESEHVHSGFVALKIKDAIVDRMREKLGKRPNVSTRDPDVRIVAHLARNQLSLSLDLCGDPLFQRGYRVKTTEAPLKETLAAAILREARYTGEEPLLDPMCGSGTLLLEAALIASRRAPALYRKLAVERWPKLGKAAHEELERLRAEAHAQERPPPAPIVGYDKDPEAVEAARKNARAANYDRYIKVEEGDATFPFDAPPGPGLLVTNPPYGERLESGGQKGMKSFYFKLGERLGQLEGYRMEILVGNSAFESAFHHRPTRSRPAWNGPIPCTLYGYPAR